MDIDSLKARIDEVERRFASWAGPLDHAYVKLIRKVNKDGYTLADYKRDMERVAQARLSEYDPYPEIEALVDEMCIAYLQAKSRMRAAIRAAVEEKRAIANGLFNYVYRSAERLRSGGDSTALKLGLAAISIENCATDFRDDFVALAELYVAAEEAGLDPKPVFAEVAGLSSAQPSRGGSTSVGEMLSEFHGYSVLAERQKKGPFKAITELANWERRSIVDPPAEPVARSERRGWLGRLFKR